MPQKTARDGEIKEWALRWHCKQCFQQWSQISFWQELKQPEFLPGSGGVHIAHFSFNKVTKLCALNQFGTKTAAFRTFDEEQRRVQSGRSLPDFLISPDGRLRPCGFCKNYRKGYASVLYLSVAQPIRAKRRFPCRGFRAVP